MKKTRIVMGLLIAALLTLVLVLPAAALGPPVEPPVVEEELLPGESMTVDKYVITPPIPPSDVTDVWWEVVECDPGLTVELEPPVYDDVAGGDIVWFYEKISVAEDACGTLYALVYFYANTYPIVGEVIGKQEIYIHVRDIVPPEVWCEEAENPHGKNIPPAGSSTLPGPKGGKNEDGFYRLRAWDNCTLPDEIEIYVGLVEIENDELKPIWAPGWDPSNPEEPPTIVFHDGDIIKVTQAPGAAPSCKKIGSSKGQAGAVRYHITVPTELDIVAIDTSGNMAYVLDDCLLVPPPPK